jgi:hypothetical protein
MPPEEAREAARKYLAKFLRAGGHEMAATSLALGLNHAYLQQYISRGKPAWLPEQVREGLVRLLPGLDTERLKPPPVPLRLQRHHRGAGHQRGDQGQINAPSDNEISDDSSALKALEALGRRLAQPGTLELLDIWDRISLEDRELALRVLRQFAEPAAAKGA